MNRHEIRHNLSQHLRKETVYKYLNPYPEGNVKCLTKGFTSFIEINC